MKRILAALLLMGLAVPSFAGIEGGVNRSSFTQTNDTGKCISGARFLDIIEIGAASPAGVLTVYDSTWTTTPIISSVSLATVSNHWYNNRAVSGICYTIVSNSAGVTIIYKR